MDNILNDTVIRRFPDPTSEVVVSDCIFELLNLPAEWSGLELCKEWSQLVGQSDDINAIYQSQQWFHLLNETAQMEPNRILSIVIVRNSSAHIIGVVPLQYSCCSPALGNNNWLTSIYKIREVHILGCDPLLPRDIDFYYKLFQHIYSWFPGCHGIRFSQVLAGSKIEKMLSTIEKDKIYKIYNVYCPLPFYVLDLAPNYEEFLSRFGSKKRYNLKRQCKILQSSMGSEVRLKIISNREDVHDFFVGLYTDINAKATSYEGYVPPSTIERNIKNFSIIAELGLLYCYAIVSGGKNLASIIGYKSNETYTVHTTYYAKSHAKYSPGTVLSCMAINDLITNQGVKWMCYGCGSPEYTFSETRICCDAVIVNNKHPMNNIRYFVHVSYCAFIRYLRSIAPKYILNSLKKYINLVREALIN